VTAIDHNGRSTVDTRPERTVRVAGEVRACLEAAVCAPSVHNSQPWLFRWRAGGIDVLADPTRRLDVVDPRGRELLVSVGAAILNLRVAILDHGRLPIQRLFPDRRQPDLVARVTPGPVTVPDPTARVLASAIPRRHTSRAPFSSLAVPSAVVDELSGAAAVEGAALAVADPAGRTALLGLTRTAEEWQRAEAGYRAELTAWTRGYPGRRDGVPEQAFGPRDRWDMAAVRDFGLTQPSGHRREAEFEPDPLVVVLSTPGDDPYHWVRAGQAMQRVLLTATVRGVSATPMTQALEVPEIRQVLTDPEHRRYPQLVLRLGYGRPAPATPRRPLADVLLPADPDPRP
jgi:nitroreductase